MVHSDGSLHIQLQNTEYFELLSNWVYLCSKPCGIISLFLDDSVSTVKNMIASMIWINFTKGKGDCMQRFLSEFNHRQSIFVGDYDSYTIISQRPSFDNLLTTAKMALLLFDQLLMPAAFFWQSEEMSRLMKYLEEPIACGFIIPVIRDCDTTNDIYEYFQRRVDESQKIGDIEAFKQPELASEIANKSHTPVVKRLESLNTYAHSDRKSVRDTFTDLWISDLKNHTDINSIRLLLCQSQMSEPKLSGVLEVFLDEARYPQFSRASCIERIQKLLPEGRIRDQIVKRTSWLYLKSNALSYDCKFYYTYDPYNRMLFEENLLLLTQTLEVFGINKNLISQLSISEILQIKESEEFHQFIVTYRRLVDASYRRQCDIVDRLKKTLTGEMRKEKWISGIFKKLQFLQATSTPVFLGLLINYFSGSTIDTPMWIATGTASTVPAVIRYFASLNHDVEAKPLSDFKEYIIAGKYQNYYDHRLGVLK